MKFWKLFLVSALVSSAFLPGVGARSVPRQRMTPSMTHRMFGKSNTVEFDLTYDFSVPGETRRMSFIVVLPKTIPNRQKILSRSYSPKPSRIFNENGN